MTAHSAEPALRFAGYAGLFDVQDAANDTIRRGAFSKTLESRSAPVPLLWQHRSDQRIGTIEYIEEDARGLRVIGLVENVRSRGSQMLRHHSVSGLSFGYRARAFRMSNEGRELIDIELFEVSLVTHPLQYGARVHLVT